MLNQSLFSTKWQDEQAALCARIAAVDLRNAHLDQVRPMYRL